MHLSTVDKCNRRISRSEIHSRDYSLPDSTKNPKDLANFSATMVARRPIGITTVYQRKSKPILVASRELKFVHKNTHESQELFKNIVLAFKPLSMQLTIMGKAKKDRFSVLFVHETSRPVLLSATSLSTKIILFYKCS